MRLIFLVSALLLGALLSVLNIWALDQYLFWRFSWFDVPLHFLGGFTIGLFVIGLAFHFRPRLFLLLTFLAIVGWELFEYSFGFPKEQNYVFDTSLDLLMGACGALVAYVLARLSLWRFV